jgi:hypothetical protein
MGENVAFACALLFGRHVICYNRDVCYKFWESAMSISIALHVLAKRYLWGII